MGRWLPGLASGEIIGAVAVAHGADALPLHPPVAFDGARLDGTAIGVTGGLAADIAVVFAEHGGAPVLPLAALGPVERVAVPSFDNNRSIPDLPFAPAPAADPTLDVEGKR